ncbi:uncharacterized protein TNCV_4409761 [Trichonephila clavipes]|nr:uncharacterized protein TNCV_4409761 [Trichonephila clavipes]
MAPWPRAPVIPQLVDRKTFRVNRWVRHLSLTSWSDYRDENCRLVDALPCWPGGSFGVCRWKFLGAVDTRRYPHAENRVWSDQENHVERGSNDRAASNSGPHSDSFNDTIRRDGDSKTFLSIAEKEPYGDSVPIVKIECAGHVQKQMGNRLRKLKALRGKKKLSDGKTIGGKGRLTDAIISKLTTFYGNAIRANSHNVNEMRQAVWAVWTHTSSTDDEPKHWFCPTGKK